MKTTMKSLMAVILLLLVSSTSLLAMDWTRIYEGVEYATATKTSPRLERAYALRISLKNPDVSFFATPGNGGGALDTWAQTTPNFRSAYGLEAAVNANFSTPGCDSGDPSDVEGLLISNGSYVSYDQLNRQSQLRITAEKDAGIYFGGNPTGIHTAVAGDWLVLGSGVPLGDGGGPVNPMTGVGVSQDGKYLIWVVVDGRQPGYSEGCTYTELGQWLLDFGAWNGYAADGGGSSCICTASGGVLNSPSDGSPRPVGANLGVNTVAATNMGPASTSWSSNNIFVMNRGHQNHVWQKYWDGSVPVWSGWSDLGGGGYRRPAVCSPEANCLYVVCVGTDNELYYRAWTYDHWSNWTPLGGYCTSGPAACSWGPDRLDIVVRGSNNVLYHSYWNGTSWSTGHALSGLSAASDPAICSWDTNRLDVFVVGPGSKLYQKTSNDGGLTWGSWSDKGGYCTSGPAVCSWGPNRIDLVVRGSGDVLYHSYFNGSTWSWGNSLGVTSCTGPSLSSRYSGMLDMFVRGTDDHLYHKTYNGSAWSGWYDLGPYY